MRSRDRKGVRGLTRKLREDIRVDGGAALGGVNGVSSITARQRHSCDSWTSEEIRRLEENHGKSTDPFHRCDFIARVL